MTNHRSSFLFVAVGVASFTVSACSGGASPPPEAQHSAAADVVAEFDGVQAVRERFNAEAARPRFLTILSAT